MYSVSEPVTSLSDLGLASTDTESSDTATESSDDARAATGNSTLGIDHEYQCSREHRSSPLLNSPPTR